MLQSLVTKPDIFIDWDKKHIAILDQDNRLIFLTKQLPKFKKQLLMNQLGTSTALSYKSGISKELHCKDKECVWTRDDYRIKFELEAMKVEISEDGVIKEILQGPQGTDFIYLNSRN